MSAPALPHNCGSWCIVVRATGDVIRETFSQRLADSIADNEATTFEVIPTIEWLQRVNSRL
jgi:hypothetical protein